MKLTLQNVYGSTIVLASIISEQRTMPQRGKYLIARLHAKLLPEFKLIDARRDELIKAYNTPQMRTETNAETGEKTQVPVDGEWQVPADKMPEFVAAWTLVGNEEIDIDVSPIPLLSLSLPDGSDGAIEASELATLGDLVFDSAS